MLDEAGIRCALRNEQLSQALPAAPFNVELWVENDEDFQKAQDLCEAWLHPRLARPAFGLAPNADSGSGASLIPAGSAEPNERQPPSSTKKEKMMKTLAGLWIDHREAVIVLLSEKGQETRRIKSLVEKQLRRSCRSSSRDAFEAQMVPADDSREREYTGHLANYYDEVISCLGPAKAILLFGPGEAKGELKKRIERDKLDLRINRIETMDKMTERQISQKVRGHYFPSGATLPPGRRSKR
jgi:hypothetical protein